MIKKQKSTPENQEFDKIYEAIYPVDWMLNNDIPDEQFAALSNHLENIVNYLKDLERKTLGQCVGDAQKKTESARLNSTLLRVAEYLSSKDNGMLTRAAMKIAGFVVERGGDSVRAERLFDKFHKLCQAEDNKALGALKRTKKPEARHKLCRDYLMFEMIIIEDIFKAAALISPRHATADRFYQRVTDRLELIAWNDFGHYYSLVSCLLRFSQNLKTFPGAVAIIEKSYETMPITMGEIASHAEVKLFRGTSWKEVLNNKEVLTDISAQTLDLMHVAAHIIVSYPHLSSLTKRASEAFKELGKGLKAANPQDAFNAFENLSLTYKKFPEDEMTPNGLSSFYGLLEHLHPRARRAEPMGDNVRKNIMINLLKWSPPPLALEQ